MKKVYRLEGLDCANCAAKLESKLNKIDGVNDAKINFLMMKLTIDINDDIFDGVIEKVKKEAAKVDDTKLI